MALLGLNKRRVVVSHAQPVSWVWKAIAFTGKVFLVYGLLVFFSNLAVNGIEYINTRVGVSFITGGLLAWVIASVVISIKRG